MVTFFIFVLTAILLLVCVFSVLLILMQRPSEDSGMGAALGGGAATSVFGGEAGNVLARWTKYSVVVFYVLSFILSMLHMSCESVPHAKNFLEKKSAVKQVSTDNDHVLSASIGDGADASHMTENIHNTSVEK